MLSSCSLATCGRGGHNMAEPLLPQALEEEGISPPEEQAVGGLP